MEDNPEIRWEILAGAADYINKHDNDCGNNEASDCDSEREEWKEIVAGWFEG